MKLEETREMLNNWFETKSVELFSKLLKGEGNREDNIYDIQFLIRDYMGCGGIIEPNSYLEFSDKVLEEAGERIGHVDDFSYEINGVRGLSTISYEEAAERNSNLTLDELKTFINAYLKNPNNRIFNLEEIENMKKELLLGKRINKKSPLQQREDLLTGLEVEEKTISEAEVLIDRQTGKDGQNIGEE